MSKVNDKDLAICNFMIESDSDDTFKFYINTDDEGEFTLYEFGSELTKVTEFSLGYYSHSDFYSTKKSIKMLYKLGVNLEKLHEIVFDIGDHAIIALRDVLSEELELFNKKGE